MQGPSSEALHLGHLVPFMFTKWLQVRGGCGCAALPVLLLACESLLLLQLLLPLPLPPPSPALLLQLTMVTYVLALKPRSAWVRCAGRVQGAAGHPADG